MWICYAVALIPLFVGAVLWISSRRITFSEWMRGLIIGLVVVTGFHLYLFYFPGFDFHMRTGRVINAVHRPERQTRHRRGTKPRRYEEAWFVTLAIGNDKERVGITQEQFREFRRQLGAAELVTVPVEGEFVGDSNNYVAMNNNSVFVPAYTVRPFRNHARSALSLHSFSEPPEGVQLFEYPVKGSKTALVGFFAVQLAAVGNPSECIPTELQFFDWRRSERLLGNAKEHYNIEAWDRLNAELGPEKNVNLILIGFDGESTNAHWQEAKWLGGKKNDLVLCYGPLTDSGKPSWTYCFGPTRDELVKRNLESALLNKVPGEEALPQIQKEVAARYRPKEQASPGYLDISPPPSAVSTLMLIMIVVQGGYWLCAYANRRHRAAVGETERQDVANEQALEWAQIRENSTRDRIATALSHLSDPTDVDELITELLTGKEPYPAVLALQRCDKPEAITGMVLAMSADDMQIRIHASDWLDDNASPSCAETRAAVPRLIERLSHGKPEIREAARAVLDVVTPDWPQTVNVPTAVDSMLQAIRSGKASDSVLDALGARGETIVDPLLSILDSDQSAAQIAAIRALGRTRSNRAAPILLKYLDHEDRTLCHAAIDGLAKFGPSLRDLAEELPACESMLALFENVEKPIQLQLIDALGWLGDKRAVETIATFMQNESWPASATAARALGHLGAPEALPYLMTRAEDIENHAGHEAIAAIGDIGDDSTADLILELLERYPDIGSRCEEACLRALARLESPEGWKYIKKVACDHPCEFSQLAGMFVKRKRDGRLQSAWSGKQRLPSQSQETRS